MPHPRTLFGRAAAAALAIALAASSAAAPAPAQRAQVRFAGGECDNLLLSGRPRTGGCKPKLVTIFYGTGPVSFVFAGRDGRMVSFLSEVVRQQGDQTSLRVRQVTVVTKGGGQASALAAKGSCILTPFAVNRSRLECKARAGKEAYAALFRTSDEDPVLLTL